MTKFHHIAAKEIDMGYGLNLDDLHAAATILAHLASILPDKEKEYKDVIVALTKKMKAACKNKEEDLAREIVGDQTKEDGSPLSYEIHRVQSAK